MSSRVIGARGLGEVAPLALLLASACIPGVNGSSQSVDGVDVPRQPSTPPNLGAVVRADRPPPAIIGGTLLVLSDDRTAVAADPDRDRVFVADYVKQAVLADIRLAEGTEPGRVVQDADRRVHVVLRRAGEILTLVGPEWKVAGRRPVCAAPRGVAWDAAGKRLHVACADGDLVSLSPDPAVTEPLRRLSLGLDLRDVIVDGDALLVSRFRSSEILTVGPTGEVIARQVPPPRRTSRPMRRPDGTFTGEQGTMSAAVAWRLLPYRTGQALLLHQRGLDGEVSVEQGGYGSSFGCGGIVESVVSAVGPAAKPNAAPSIPQALLAVDAAVSPDLKRLAVISPGNARMPPGAPFQQLQVMSSSEVDREATECAGAKRPGPAEPPVVMPPRPDAGDGPETDELPPPAAELHQPTGEATAVAFDRRGHLLVQTREPAAMIQIVTVPGVRSVVLARDSRADSGHAVFHTNSGAGLACASCHPEGGEDGRVWKFNVKGKTEVRRTQSLRGGIGQTAPFHWNGDLKDLSVLMREVFVGRMSGPELQPPFVEALKDWMDRIPPLPALGARDPAAVERGRAVFHGATAACATCHGGPQLTNNTTVDVGTGRAMQVPSLRGVAWRAPFMHDGCAATLKDRFAGACGGGDKHGAISKLTPGQIADLVAFMETL